MAFKEKSDAFGRRFFFVGREELVSGFRRPEHLPRGSENDPPVETERPVLQIINVESHPIAHVLGLSGFTTETFHLSEAGDAGFDEAAEPVGFGDTPEFAIMLDHVRTGSDDTHFAPENVDELG